MVKVYNVNFYILFTMHEIWNTHLIFYAKMWFWWVLRCLFFLGVGHLALFITCWSKMVQNITNWKIGPLFYSKMHVKVMFIFKRSLLLRFLLISKKKKIKTENASLSCVFKIYIYINASCCSTRSPGPLGRETPVWIWRLYSANKWG